MPRPPSRPALVKQPATHPVEALAEASLPPAPPPATTPAAESTVMFAFRVPRSLRRRMRQLAAALDRPIQELSIEALEQYIAAHDEQQR
jgi:hypothetical protein